MNKTIPALLLSGLTFSCSTHVEDPSPNILILLADDMGYRDPGYMGGKANTPNLDRLAAEGISFTNFYSGAPNCSPSRVALLTGKIPARAGMYNYRDPNSVMHLRDKEYTLAEMLQKKDYQTVHLGKWHLGALGPEARFEHPGPSDQGFDYYFATENNAQPSHLNPVNFIRNGRKTGEQKGYSCQLLADEFIEWFENEYDPSRPFFQYVAFHEPHKKVASPPELIENYPGMDFQDAEYLANLENMDLAVGRMVDLLEDKGLLDNTLVFFASDNGPYREASRGELRGRKSFIWEGGIRVPAFLHWPNGGVTVGKIEDPAWLGDIFPTLAGICRAEVPKMDGEDISSLIYGGEFERKNSLLWFFYRTYPEIAIRKGDYTMVGYSNDSLIHTHYFSARDMEFVKTIDFVRFELYDVSVDAGQENDLGEEHPEVFAEMKDLLLDSFRELQEDFPEWEDIQPFSPESASPRFKPTGR